MPDISIAIVNWNTAELVLGCLSSLFDQKWEASFEVILVDNGSTDNSVGKVSSQFPQVKLIINNENVGFAKANNQALARAQGRFLLLLNSDTLVLPGALDKMVGFMDRNPEAGIVGCKLLNSDGSVQASCSTFPNLRTALFRALYLDKLFPRNSWTGANRMSYWNYNSTREVEVVQGSCMLVRREVLDQVGALDEHFFMYSEETDWCYRARQHGWKIYFTPEAEIIHYGAKSSRQSARMRVVFHQSRIKYFQKHYGWLTSVIARLLAALEVGLRLIYWSASLLIRRRKRLQALNMMGAYWPALRWLLGGRSL